MDLNLLKDEFITLCKREQYSSLTIEKYERIVTNLISYLSGKELNKDSLIEYQDSLRESDHCPVTMNCYSVIINKFVKYVELRKTNDHVTMAMVKHHYDEEMMLRLDRIQEKSSINTLSQTEYKRLLGRAKKTNRTRSYLLMRVFGETGIRVSELKYFTYENIDAYKTNGCISIYGKGRKERNIIVPDDLIKELKDYCKANRIKNGYIFYTERDRSTCLPGQVINKDFKKIAKECGGVNVKLVHCHSFRHLYALYLLDNGFSQGDAQDLLGHSDINTTAGYTRSSLRHKQGKINDAFRHKKNNTKKSKK